MIESPWLKVYSRRFKYPKPWQKGMIQKIILRAAGHTCEHCGATQEDALLHVHHLTWLNKHDCTYQNLVSVCTSCHVRIHNYKWQPGKPWLERWGQVPVWAVLRGHLSNNGQPLIIDANAISDSTVDANAISGGVEASIPEV